MRPSCVETIYKRPNNLNILCADFHTLFVTLIEHDNFGIHRVHNNFTDLLEILPFHLKVGLFSF